LTRAISIIGNGAYRQGLGTVLVTQPRTFQ
jgi:hypothetical protein